MGLEWKAAIEKDGSKSKYAIVRGKQSIAKYYLDGCTLFELWHGDERIGHFECPKEAKAKADVLLADR